MTSELTALEPRHLEKPFQLYIALSGDTEHQVFEQLQSIYFDCCAGDKPTQGTASNGDSIKTVITPTWNGDPY